MVQPANESNSIITKPRVYGISTLTLVALGIFKPQWRRTALISGAITFTALVVTAQGKKSPAKPLSPNTGKPKPAHSSPPSVDGGSYDQLSRSIPERFNETTLREAVDIHMENEGLEAVFAKGLLPYFEGSSQEAAIRAACFDVFQQDPIGFAENVKNSKPFESMIVSLEILPQEKTLAVLDLVWLETTWNYEYAPDTRRSDIIDLLNARNYTTSEKAEQDGYPCESFGITDNDLTGREQISPDAAANIDQLVIWRHGEAITEHQIQEEVDVRCVDISSLIEFGAHAIQYASNADVLLKQGLEQLLAAPCTPGNLLIWDNRLIPEQAIEPVNTFYDMLSKAEAASQEEFAASSREQAEATYQAKYQMLHKALKNTCTPFLA